MHLTHLSVERYKCFAQREDLEIRPLTLFIGRNSSGKSVLARLPLLLRHALSGQAVAPLDVSVDGVEFGGSFLDLVHGRAPHGSLGLGFRVEGGQGDFGDWWVEVQRIDETKLQVVKRLDVASRLGDFHLTWDMSATTDPSRPHYQDAGNGRTYPVGFRGLLPNPPTDRSASLFGASLRALQAFDPLRYLGPFRQVPSRDYGYPGGRIQDVGPSGTLAAAALGADMAHTGRSVLEAVALFYETHLGGWRLDVEEHGERFSLVVRSPGREKTIVNLVDAGVGLSQVLPLVVQRYLDAASGNGGGIEIVEQPELHLHPAAHAALADLYVDALESRPCPRFIIETHSENFILRIRRRIAEGRVSADDVALYWTDDSTGHGSRARHIPIDAQGDVDATAWPRGVFSEDFEEVKAMRRAQQRRSP